MAHYDEEGNLVLDPEDFESESNPYVKRFNDYRSEADRRQTEFQQTQQRLGDLTSDDPEKQRAAAEALGLQWVEPDDGEPAGQHVPDPQLSALEQRIAKFEAAEAAREEQQKQAEAVAAFSASMDAEVARLGMNPQHKDTAIIIAHAANNFPFLESGLPDLESARAELEARDNETFEGWRKSKRTPLVQKGQTGTERIALEDMDAEDRITWAMEQHGVE
jgi:hypothetical protein